MWRCLSTLPLLAALASAQAPPPSPVVVAAVSTDRVRPQQDFVGTVRASRQVEVQSEAEGLVVELSVRKGDAVEAGQVLARLRTKTVEIDLAEAEAQLDLRHQELAELQNGTRPEEIAEAEATLADAVAEEHYRDWALQKAEELLKNETGTEEVVRRARWEKEHATATRQAAEAKLALLREGPRKEQIAQARAAASAQEEVVRRLQDSLERHTITAPFEGWVVAERTEAGAWMGTGDAVVEMMALDPVEVVVAVPEEHVGHLTVGDQVPVTVEALADRHFTGEIVGVVPRADLQSRSFPVRIRVQNTRVGGQPLLKDGMFAHASLPVGAAEQAVLVPKDALVLGGPAPTVYVIEKHDDGSVVQPRVVTLGAAVGDRVIVRSGLEAGDRVVVRGNERLRPGQAVQVIEQAAEGSSR